ncbi:MAG TPA: hypothetical protein PK581_06260 [Caldisericia bacterium]|nr:hypothetical protein [Caldisericia bacterium]
MVGARDSENQETQIDKPKASGSAMPLFPWFDALKFSLRVMRKSFFKLFIPAMALSYVMGALLALIAFDADFISSHVLFFFPIIVVFICVISLPVYAYLYPLLKRHVLFLGMQELCPHVLMDYKKSLRKIDYSPLSDFVSISFVRFLFQSLSFLLFMLYFALFFFGSFKIVWFMGQVIISVIALLPVTWSYFTYFFAELHAIDRLIQEAKIHSVHPVSIFWSHEIDETTQVENPDIIRSKKIIRPDKKLFLPILTWKALLLVVYMALVFALGIWYTRSGMATQSIMDYTNNFLYAIGGLPVFLFGYLFHPVFEPVLNAIFKLRMDQHWFIWSYRSSSDIFLENPNAIWILLFFLLLFGLMTAFFFLVETLSSVYFYHGCRGKSLQEVGDA